MRWENLFDDLESQLEHELSSDELDLRAQEERLRLARLSLRDRLMTFVAGPGPAAPMAAALIQVWLVDGSSLTIRPLTFGKDWLSVEVIGEQAETAGQCILPIASITSLGVSGADLVRSLAPQGDENPASLGSARGQAREGHERLIDRLGIAFVLRDFCRRRTPLSLITAAGSFRGTIDRVARDHLDIALHEPGSPRRESNVTDYRMVPFGSIVLVRV